MIGSELSQNIAALVAKFKAVFELLVTKSSQLEKQQVVIQDDYSRISDRYIKIFNNLDEELEKRVVALDKNVFELSKRVQSEQLHSETSKKVTQFLIGVNEDEIVQHATRHHQQSLPSRMTSELPLLRLFFHTFQVHGLVDHSGNLTVSSERKPTDTELRFSLLEFQQGLSADVEKEIELFYPDVEEFGKKEVTGLVDYNK